MEEKIKELYDSLKGNSRVIQGELTIPDFTEEDYEELYVMILEILAPVIKGNYEYFYTKWARAYHKEKQRKSRTFNFVDVQFEKDVFSQTIREQLATLKFYIQRRAYSRFPLKI